MKPYFYFVILQVRKKPWIRFVDPELLYGSSGARTHDLLVVTQTLSQLSYASEDDRYGCNYTPFFSILQVKMTKMYLLRFILLRRDY